MSSINNILFVFIILLFGCSGIEEEQSQNDMSKRNGDYYWWIDVSGKGEWIKKSDDGSWEPVDGTLFEYRESGKLKLSKEYRDGKLNGMASAYDRNGDLFYYYHSTNSVADSVFQMYYPNGQMQYETFFDKGGFTTITFYYENGELESELQGYFSRGRYEFIDEQKFYHQDGKLKLVAQNDTIKIYDQSNKLKKAIPKTKGNFDIYFNLAFVPSFIVPAIVNGDVADRFCNNFGCVTGDCNNGNGELKTPSGTTYKGHFANGLFDGDGKIYDVHGELIYEGFFQDHMLVGECVINEIEYSYEGGVLNNQPHGYGEMTHMDGHIVKAIFVNGVINDSLAVFMLVDGSKYIGSVVNDIMEGKGMIFKPDGDSIAGNFKSNEMDGACIYYHTNGDKEVRVYKSGVLISAEEQK